MSGETGSLVSRLDTCSVTLSKPHDTLFGYDWLKLEVLNRKNDARIGGQGRDGIRHQRSPSTGVWVENSNPIINRNKLTMMTLIATNWIRAFTIGVIAKAAATLIVPLLRAKVLMMTSTDVRDTLANKEEDKRKAKKGMSHVTTFGQSLNQEEEDDVIDDGDCAAGSDRLDSKTRKRSTSIHQFIRRSDAGKLYDIGITFPCTRAIWTICRRPYPLGPHYIAWCLEHVSQRTFGAAPEAARGNA